MDTTQTNPAPPTAAAPSAAPAPVATASLITTMVRTAKNTNDFIFSPGRAPQVEQHGQLIQLKIQGVGVLAAEDTARIAADLIGRNSGALQKLKE